MAPTLTCEMAFAGGPYAANPTRTNLSTRLRADQELVIIRGRSHALGRMEPGYATLLLDNRDRALDPWNASSPYAPVLPRRQLWLRATEAGVNYPLFAGLARFNPSYAEGGGRDATVAVRAVDALDLFAQTPLIAFPIATWMPPGYTTVQTINLFPQVPVAGGGQIKVALSAAPTATGQTVQIWGTIAGTMDSESYVFGAGNWQGGIVGEKIFELVTAIQTFTGNGIYQEIQVTALPAYRGSTGGATPGATGGATEQLGRILDYVGWPVALRAFDTGDVSITSWAATQQSGWDPAATRAAGVADTVQSAIERLMNAENGAVFVRGDGAIVFHSRGRRTSHYDPTAPVFGTGPDEIPYQQPTFADGDDDVVTEARLTRSNGVELYAIADPATLERSGRRTYSQGGVLSSQNALTQAWAQRLVNHYGVAVPRLTSITLTGGMCPWPTMLGLDLQKRIIVRLRLPGAAAPIDHAYAIERMEWRLRRMANAIGGTLTLGLSPASLLNDLYQILGV